MDPKEPLLTAHKHVPIITIETERAANVARPVATRDHDLIRRWALSHQAEPATGEATNSGPATLDVNDGGTGIRFNFPGFGRFRTISWEEWFENFDKYELVLVYEEVHDDAAQPSPRYRIVKTADWKDQIS